MLFGGGGDGGNEGCGVVVVVLGDVFGAAAA